MNMDKRKKRFPITKAKEPGFKMVEFNTRIWQDGPTTHVGCYLMHKIGPNTVGTQDKFMFNMMELELNEINENQVKQRFTQREKLRGKWGLAKISQGKSTGERGLDEMPPFGSLSPPPLSCSYFLSFFISTFSDFSPLLLCP